MSNWEFTSRATAIDKTEARENASLTELAAEKKDEEKSAAKKEESKSLTIGQKIKKELHHYWDGTKLLGTEVKISFRLALKMAAGYDLSRRENRQVRQLTIHLHFSAMLTSFLSSNAPSKIFVPCSFLRFRHSTIRRVPPASGTEAFP